LGQNAPAIHSQMPYLAKWRMQVASGMLNRADVNMETSAAEIGYESEAAFARSRR
jgi:transcriptional regulator GlxA family with amidase domain